MKNLNWNLAVPFVAGAASACGFEPLGLWPLTLIAIAALMLEITYAPTRRAAFGRGMLFGAGHFLVGLNWIVTAFTYFRGHQVLQPGQFGTQSVSVARFRLIRLFL